MTHSETSPGHARTLAEGGTRAPLEKKLRVANPFHALLVQNLPVANLEAGLLLTALSKTVE